MRNASPAVKVFLSVCMAWATTAAADHPPLAKAPFDVTQAKEFQQQWSKHIGKQLIETNSIGMKLVLLPPGEFTMGRTEEQFDKLLEVVNTGEADDASVGTVMAVGEATVLPPPRTSACPASSTRSCPSPAPARRFAARV